jgi:serine/threonine protein kinase
MNIIVANKYCVNKLIGQGTFGKVFKATTLAEHKDVVIKISASSNETIENEQRMYQILAETPGIPSLWDYGTEGRFSYIVIDYLGLSLEQLLAQQKESKFTLKTVISIGLQSLKRLEDIHGMGIVHRDIKPSNFLIGLHDKHYKLMLIDFGLANIYVQDDGSLTPESRNKSFIGTSRYASIAVHDGRTYGRKDDLESLSYLLIYLLRGELPWQTSIQDEAESSGFSGIAELKRKYASSFQSDVPGEFIIFMNYCQSLPYDSIPNYNYLKNLLLNLYKMKGFKVDNVMDWSEYYLLKPLKDMEEL